MIVRPQLLTNQLGSIVKVATTAAILDYLQEHAKVIKAGKFY